MATAKVEKREINVILTLSLREAFIIQHLLCTTNQDLKETDTKIEQEICDISNVLGHLNIYADNYEDLFQNARNEDGLKQNPDAEEFLTEYVNNYE